MCIRFMIHFSLSIHSFSFYKGRDVVVSTHNIYTSSLPTPSLFIGGEMLWYPPTTSIHHTSYRTSHRTSCHTSYRTSHRISHRTSHRISDHITCLSHVTFARCIHMRMIARCHLTVVCHVSYQSLLTHSITVVSMGLSMPLPCPCLIACCSLCISCSFFIFLHLFLSIPHRFFSFFLFAKM